MTFRQKTRLVLLILALGLASLALAQAKATKKTTTTTKAPTETETTTSTKPPSDKRTTTTKGPDTTAKAKTKETKETKDEDSPDDKAIKKLINDKSDELNLLEKLSESYGTWKAWVVAHDGKTLNRFKASGIFDFIKKTMPTYFGGEKVVNFNTLDDSWLS